MVNLFTKTPRMTGHSLFFSYQVFLSLLMVSFLLGALPNSAFSAGYDWQAQQRQQQMMQQQMMRQQQMQQQQQMMRQQQMQQQQRQMQQQQQMRQQQQAQQRQMQQQQMTRQQQTRQQRQQQIPRIQSGNMANRVESNPTSRQNQYMRVPNTPKIVSRTSRLSEKFNQESYKSQMRARLDAIKRAKRKNGSSGGGGNGGDKWDRGNLSKQFNSVNSRKRWEGGGLSKKFNSASGADQSDSDNTTPPKLELNYPGPKF
jgi:hypothetical protein